VVVVGKVKGLQLMKRYLIIGGAGFIGINAADHYARRGEAVTILDNFSRRGTNQNVAWLTDEHPSIRVVRADIRTDQDILAEEAAACDVLLHLGAQVAVTTSVTDPRTDFEINAVGTFNVLEAARLAAHPPILIFSSTNKVYGGMEHVEVVENGNRYSYKDLPWGASEQEPLDFHSPYGCSKGAADQYVHDYFRIYGLRTVVLRQSCIYGPHQFGIEDQGWVAWFGLCNLLRNPLTIYGDGKQIRDVLYIGDLVAVFDAAVAHIDAAAGKVFNIGGGPQRTLSLLELLDLYERITGVKTGYTFSDWRPGDQRVYVSDIRRADRLLGWAPKVAAEEGVRRMLDWMIANQNTIFDVYQGQRLTAHV
jgi:CDP-paratose 2-epimerase